MIVFAHRGARSQLPENTLPAFRLALQQGATGLESDVWLTADGVPVLDHDGVVRDRRFGPERPLSELSRRQLPEHIPTLAELYETCGTGYELSLDVKDTAAADAIVRVARDAGAAERLWLCGRRDLALLARWARRYPEVHLVDDAQHHRHIPEGTTRRARRLHETGVAALNLPVWLWTARHIAAVRAEGVAAFGWRVNGGLRVRRALTLNLDAVYSDYVPPLVASTHR